MRRWLQRINRGIILLILLVVGVVVYCCIDAYHHRAQRDRIEEVVVRHIEESTVLYTFPEIPNVSPQDASELSEQHIDSLYERAFALSHDLSSNEAIRQEIANQYVTMLQRVTIYFRKFPTTCTREVVSFHVEEIYHDSAIVRLEIENKFTLTDEDGKSHVDSINSIEYYYLLVENDEWKIYSIESDISEIL